MSKYGLTVMICLLFAGGLIAGQASAGPTVMAGASLPPGLHAVPAGDPDRAPEGVNIQAPPEVYQQDAVTWSTRAVFPGTAVYRGNWGAFERTADTSILYAIGGQGSSIYSNCYRYNSRTNTWTAMASMPVTGSNMTAVYWQDDGGGTDSSGVWELGIYSSGYYTSCYKWTKSSNSWASYTSYGSSQSSAGNMACCVGDSLFLLWNQSSFSRLSIRQGTWASRTSPPTSAYYGAMCNGQGKVYQCDGFYATCFQCYDPVAGTWSTKAAHPSSMGGNTPCLAAWDTGGVHRVYLWGGGYYWTPYNGVAWYDAGSNTWTTEGTLPEAVLGAFFGPIREYPGPIEGLNHATGYNGSYITTHRRGIPDVPQPTDVVV